MITKFGIITINQNKDVTAKYFTFTGVSNYNKEIYKELIKIGLKGIWKEFKHACFRMVEDREEKM